MLLFIDTNIFLSFYHLTSEDLEELKKLAVLIENKEIRLSLPQQVIDETFRNRASKINDSFESLKKAKFSSSYPAYCKEYPQYKEMRRRQKETEELHAEMVKAIQTDVEKNNLAADLLLQRLIKIANVIERTPEIVSKARERVELGNPPGKKGSIGDAVNWESLLASVRDRSKLVVIADDSDFFSALNSEVGNDFLLSEWHTRKKSKPEFYRRLSSFFKKHYPNINLKTEQEKDALIERLAASSNFAATHSLIAELSKHDGFTQKQVEDLVNSLLMNNQVQWIIKDEDVHAFYRNIYSKYFFSLPDDVDEQLKALLDKSNTSAESDDEIPF